MARTLESKLIISMVDKFTAPLRGIDARIKSINGLIAGNNSRLDSMRGQMLDAAGAAYALGKAVISPTKTAADFQEMMIRVRVATEATAEQMEAMRKLARQQGRETSFTASASAEAMEMLAKNGLGATQILGGASAATLALAEATGSGLAPAADLTTDVMANFRKQAHELMKINDGIVGTLKVSKFGFNDYQLAISQAGGVAGGLGVSIEDFNTAIAATSTLFSSGSDAGTSFKTFLQRMVPASTAAQKAMAKYNLRFFDAKGNMRSMAEIAESLRHGLSGLSDEAKTDVLTTVFGTDAMRTAIGLMNAGKAGIDEFNAKIGQASAAKDAAARMEGFNGAMREFQSVVEDVNISLGEALLPTLTDLLKSLGPIIGSIGAFAEKNPILIRSLIGLTAGLVGFRVATTAAGWAGLYMAGSVLRMQRGALLTMKGLGKLGKGLKALTIGPITAGFKALATQLASFRWAASGLGKGGALAILGRNLVGLLNPLRLLPTAINAVKWAMRGLLIGTGAGVIFVAVGAAAEWAIKNWDNLKVAFAEFKKAFLDGIKPLENDETFNKIAREAGGLLDGIRRLTSEGDVTAFAEAGAKAGRSMAEAFLFLADQIERVINLIDRVNKEIKAFSEWQQQGPGQWGADIGKALGTDRVGPWLARTLGLAGEDPGDRSALESLGINIGLMPPELDVAEITKALPPIKPVFEFEGLEGMSRLAGETAGTTLGTGLASSIRSEQPRVMSDVRAIYDQVKATFAAGIRLPVSVMATPWANRGMTVDAPHPVARPIDGARAAGGPVWGSGNFLVGEQGPELFSPRRNGFILPAAATAALAALSAPSLAAATNELHRISAPAVDHAGAQSSLFQQTRGAAPAKEANRNVTISPTIHINMNITGVNDPDKIARELGRRVSERLEGALFDIDTGV